MSSNRKAGPVISLALLLLAVVAVRALHWRYDEPWLPPLEPRDSEARGDLSEVWMGFMAGEPDAHPHAVAAIEAHFGPSEAGEVLRLLPSADDDWLTTSRPPSIEVSGPLRIVAPRGRIVGPGATVVVGGLDLSKLLWSVHLQGGDELLIQETDGVDRFRVVGELPTAVDLVLTVKRQSSGETLAQSGFSVASTKERVRLQRDLSELKRIIFRSVPRLYGQMILAMKGGFYGAAADVATRIQGDQSPGYLHRLLFLHEFHGRREAADGVREQLKALR